jgi:hypothetical protein
MMRSRVLLVIVSLALFAPGTFAAAPDETAAFLDPKNWEGRSDIFKIEGNTIIGETQEDPKYNTFFCTKAKYSDFEMTFKVLLRDGVGNSGVQIRSELFDKEKFRVRGPQVDIGKGYWGSLYGEGVGGMMQASAPAKIMRVVKETEVNDYKIIAKGNRVTVMINGEAMVDADFPTLPGKDMKPAPKDGIIAVQVHGGYPKMRVELRDITFKTLK